METLWREIKFYLELKVKPHNKQACKLYKEVLGEEILQTKRNITNGGLEPPRLAPPNSLLTSHRRSLKMALLEATKPDESP